MFVTVLAWRDISDGFRGLIGFVYPAFSSLVAIKNNPDDIPKFWLVYFITTSKLAVLETLLDTTSYLFTLYLLAKLVFVVWCFLPQTRGAEIIHNAVIEPVFFGMVLPKLCGAPSMSKKTDGSTSKKAE